tara:strand:- start:5190 stop:5708 length:519 start_codon:yes stop_codon:yes gene_type:complete
MKKIIIILTFLLSQINFAISDTSIAFVDLDKIVKTSKPGASILKQLNKKNEQILVNFQNEEKNIKKKETKLISQKKMLSDEEFQSKVTKLKIEINKYNDKRIKTINDFKKLKIGSTNNFLKMINPILIKYSDEKSISLIMQKKNLIIGKTELDITDEIIKIINNNIKEFEIK